MNQRWAFYLMTIASCGLLAGVFANRGQVWIAAGMGVIAVGYLIRGIWVQRQEITERRAELTADLAGPQTTAEKRAIVANLWETRDHLRGARQREILMGFVVLIVVVLMQPNNQLFAFVISLLFLPIIFLIYRHTRAIVQIERGLAERGLLPNRKP